MKTATKLLIILFLLTALVLPLAALAALYPFRTAQQTVLQVAPQVAPQVVRVVAPQVRSSVGHVFWVFPRNNLAQGSSGDRLVLGGTFTLKSGETQEGSLFVLGGNVQLDQGSHVQGDIVLLGGSINANGEVDGSVTAVGGSINLAATAVVQGDVNDIGGSINRDPEARVKGQINSSSGGPFPPIVIPGQIRVPNVNWTPDYGWSLVGLFGKMLWWLGRSFIWAILALLLVLFLPEHVERAAAAVVEQPVIAGGLGLMTIVVAPLLLVVIMITIIGIPFSLLGIFLLVVAWAFGVITVGLEIGKRLARALKQEWAPAVEAGLGTLVLTLVANGIGGLIPCVGWMVPALVGMLGLGAVLLTRFGTVNYPPGTMLTPQPPASPPTPPEPPVPAEPVEPDLEDSSQNQA
jgi:hypothetical protein